jgi:hypothetical protein
VAADVIAPRIPSRDASLASLVKSINLGAEVTASIPRITITMISSINVNPCCLLYCLIMLSIPLVVLANYNITLFGGNIQREYEFQMDEVKQKIALFIDADNAPASKFEKVLSEVAKYGLVTIRKV